MNDFTVDEFGNDVSRKHRTIWMTRYMHSVWQGIKADPLVAPFADKLLIVQGAFMTRNGGGADASEGYHDEGGCIDVRTWNLTKGELETFIRVARMHGWAFWRRDKAHGNMEAHAHGVLGTDKPLAPGVMDQWIDYLNGGTGLASGGKDYEWRPDPLVRRPTPDQLVEEDDMAWDEKVDKWFPGDPDKDDELTAKQQLAQARGYAFSAFTAVARLEKAMAALAAGMDPEVEKAVKAALKH